MDRPKLIFGDTVRTAEIIRLRSCSRIFLRRTLAQTPEYAVDLFLR
jgi:hypothetical protein